MADYKPTGNYDGHYAVGAPANRSTFSNRHPIIEDLRRRQRIAAGEEGNGWMADGLQTRLQMEQGAQAQKDATASMFASHRAQESSPGETAERLRAAQHRIPGSGLNLNPTKYGKIMEMRRNWGPMYEMLPGQRERDDSVIASEYPNSDHAQRFFGGGGQPVPPSGPEAMEKMQIIQSLLSKLGRG